MLFLTLHALQRMRARGISRDEVQQALANRQTQYSSDDFSDTRLIILGQTASGRRLKVVVVADDEDRIITVADRDAED